MVAVQPPGLSAPVDDHAQRAFKGRLRRPLKIVAYLTDEISIKRILDHLGLSPPERKSR